MTMTLNYLVYIAEGSHQIERCRFARRIDAEQYALHCVDDALPHNSAVVVDLQTGMQIGYAAMAGDGSKYFEQTSGVPSRYRGALATEGA